MLSIDKVISPPAREKIRKEIEEVSGNEVVFRGIRGENYPVNDVEVLGYGNESLSTFNYKRLQPYDVLIHNHPSGDITPSRQDISIASILLENQISSVIVDNNVERIYIITPIFTIEPQKIDVDEIEITKFWKENGFLKSVLNEFEDRKDQLNMALNVMEAINHNQIAIIEAGTGTGKSIAYLLPAILYATKNKEKVVVSTYTIALQEQLFYKDIPLLQKLKGLKFKTAILIGRGNFACRRKTEELKQNQLFDSTKIEIISSWLSGTTEGLLQELQGIIDSETRELISSKQETCMRLKCPFYKDCFYYNYRKKALEADIIIVNQHLLLSDIYLRATSSMEITGVLPPYRKLIIDEAHHIDEVAGSIWGYELSYLGLLRLIGGIYKAEKNEEKGILLIIEDKFNKLYIDYDFSEIKKTITSKYNKLKETLGILYKYIQEKKKDEESIQYSSDFNPLLENIKLIFEEVKNIFIKLESKLDEIEKDEEIENLKEEAWLEINSYIGKIQRIIDGINRIITNEEGYIYWFSVGEKEYSLKINATPTKPNELLKEYLWPYLESIILTSATLSVENSFDFYKRKIGIESEFEIRGKEYIYKSPFNYRKQVRLYIPKDMPDVTKKDFIDSVVKIASDLYNSVLGGILFLFTSYSMMKKVYERIKNNYPYIDVIKQGDISRKQIIDRMKLQESGIVLATSSFWEGVDLPGKALRCLVIVRLPFPVPTNPVVSAICQEIEKEGKSSFQNYMLPVAITTFRQGFGRLIRKKTDYGIVIVLDKRILTKNYGKSFIASIPPIKYNHQVWEKQLLDISEFLHTFE
jgi:ATP-dependent DNA helicase DinG